MNESDATRLLALARSTPSNLRYFFEHLVDPGWIDVLKREGFFENPPDIDRTEDDDGTWLRFPDWPASRYLVRMASQEPEAVARVLVELPPTENVRIHEDVVEAAQQLPTGLADTLATAELRWFISSSGPLLNFATKFVGLGLYLLRSGIDESAIAIFDAVFAVDADEDPRAVRPLVSARLPTWEYDRALTEVWPTLIEFRGADGLRFIASKLLRATELSIGDDGHDYSYIWRSAIEDHAQNVGRTIFDSLVDAVRDASVSLAEHDPSGVVELLGEFQAPIFKRLRLYVLRERGDAIPSVTAAAILDREAVYSTYLWHEYAELLRVHFAQLQSAEQSRLLALIRTGTTAIPSTSPEEAEPPSSHARFQRLAMIADRLEGDDRDDYEQLLSQYGPPEHPEFLAHTSSWTGPTSPLSADELRKRTPTEIVAFLDDWQPERSVGPHPSPEGLGRILTDVVAESPEPFAREASKFVNSEATYVRAVIEGLSQAAKGGRSFDWVEPLALARWVLDQGEVRDAPLSDVDRDPGWGWTRKAIAGLLGHGFEDGPASLPPEKRGDVWQLLAALAEDPNPTPAQESDEGGMDPATRSLNVTRGEAMHSIVRYVLWVERIDREAFHGLASVPEAQAVLERHLDPAIDPSPAVRAVYGMWLAQLIRLDERWFAEHVGEILPSDTSQSRLFSAAWHSYVTFTRPWLGVFDQTADAYALAVQRLVDDRAESGRRDRPDETLAEHLVWYAAMGAIPIDEPGLWQEFWQRAPGELRQHAVTHLGRMFKGATEVPADVRERVEQLWRWILHHTDELERSRTLAAFGWLFSAEALDDEWLLTQALALLQEGIYLDADFVIWDALSRIVEAHPGDSAGLLRMMIQVDPQGWAVMGSEQSVRQILEKALKSGNPEAQRRANDAINLLGARGLQNFRDLADDFRP